MVLRFYIFVLTDRAALSPEAEDEWDEGDEARHHPDVAETIKAVLIWGLLVFQLVFTLEYLLRTTTRSYQAEFL